MLQVVFPFFRRHVLYVFLFFFTFDIHFTKLVVKKKKKSWSRTSPSKKQDLRARQTHNIL